MEVSNQLHAPTALLAEEEPPLSIGQEVWWTLWTLWSKEKSVASVGNRTSVRRYTDWAIPAPTLAIDFAKKSDILKQ
jgi:hypothetical protein